MNSLEYIVNLHKIQRKYFFDSDAFLDPVSGAKEMI